MTDSTLRARIVLRPRSLDEVFDLALAYLRVHFRDLRGLLALSVLLPLAGGPIAAGGLMLLDRPPSEIGAALVIAFLLFSEISGRLVTAFVGRHLFERPVGVRQALRLTGSPRWLVSFGLLWAPLALVVGTDTTENQSTVLVMVWVLGFGLSSLIRAWASHSSEVEVLERLRGGEARKRAIDLSSLRQGRNLAFVAQAFLVRLLFVATAVGATYTLFDFTLQFDVAMEVLGPFGAMLGYAVSTPYVSLARLFDYIDARTRGEGWDIQVLFQGIWERAQPGRRDQAA